MFGISSGTSLNKKKKFFCGGNCSLVPLIYFEITASMVDFLRAGHI